VLDGPRLEPAGDDGGAEIGPVQQDPENAVVARDKVRAADSVAQLALAGAVALGYMPPDGLAEEALRGPLMYNRRRE
jgi:hypothetical protein